LLGQTRGSGRTGRAQMSHGFLVTFSGLDGSGKSSQAVTLQRSLAGRNISVARAWAGQKPMLSYPFLALVRFLGYTHRRKIQGVAFVERDLRRNRALARLWPLVLALDFVPKTIVSVRLPLRKGRIVICDRYVYDLLAELLHEGMLGERTKRMLIELTPRADLAFLMDVDEKLAWERALVPGRAREQPYYDLLQRRKVYLELGREMGMVVMNGQGDVAQNHRMILTKTMDGLMKAGFGDNSKGRTE